MPARRKSYLYYGSKSIGNGAARRSMNLSFANRYRYIYHRKSPHSIAYRAKVNRFLTAQTAAHPTFGSRLRDDSRTAPRKVSFNRYCRMPITKRRKVDVRGWDTRFGHMYKWEMGRKVYRHHKHLTEHIHGRPKNLYRARYTNSKGHSRSIRY
jgi:hypothetical protein